MSMPIRVNDFVEWDAPQFSGSFKNAKFIGVKRKLGIVLRHSYGLDKGQHTFTILHKDGTKTLVKGRNLYPNLISHKVDFNSLDRKE